MALLVGAILLVGLGRARADAVAPGLFVVAAAGGYRFADFVRVGRPFPLIVGLVSVTLVPWLVRFH
jgi:di/tricarboxylate transporter